MSAAPIVAEMVVRDASGVFHRAVLIESTVPEDPRPVVSLVCEDYTLQLVSQLEALPDFVPEHELCAWCYVSKHPRRRP